MCGSKLLRNPRSRVTDSCNLLGLGLYLHRYEGYHTANKENAEDSAWYPAQSVAEGEITGDE